MEAVAENRAADGPALGLLIDQRRLVRLQIAGERMSNLLKMGTGALGLIVAAALAMMVWKAAHADGVVVHAFSVSPQMAAQGVSGEVLAGEVLDHINVQLATAVNTAMKRSTSIVGSGGEDLRLEIPQTGVSIGDLYRALRGWLGHERAITGAMTQSGDTITLTVRFADQPAVSVSGAASDRAAVVRAAAEKILARADPIRAIFYLNTQNRTAEVDALLAEMRSVGTPSDRAGGFAFTSTGIDDPYEHLRFAREAVSIDPSTVMGYSELSVALTQLGRWEEALTANRTFTRHLAASKSALWGKNSHARMQHVAAGREAEFFGDFARYFAEAQASANIRQTAENFNSEAVLIPIAVLAHDINGAQRLLERATLRGVDTATLRIPRAQVDLATGRWAQAIEALTAVLADPARNARRLPRTSDLAIAKAKAGDAAGAAIVIAPTPMDCYPCLRARGIVAAQAGDAAGADYWFAMAVRVGPSFPMAQAEWARALLDRGESAAALTKARDAHAKGPKFADPLELWGEALLAKGDAKSAVRKFAQADQYAPRWGRLHLKWGQALQKLGKTEEAKAQFAAAGRLALTKAERAELQAMTKKRTN